MDIMAWRVDGGVDGWKNGDLEVVTSKIRKRARHKLVAPSQDEVHSTKKGHSHEITKPKK